MSELREIAMNDLAFRTVNVVPYEPSETVAESIDGLAEMLRRASLAIAAGLFAIADEIEKGRRP
jgi:hypothetical protein